MYLLIIVLLFFLASKIIFMFLTKYFLLINVQCNALFYSKASCFQFRPLCDDSTVVCRIYCFISGTVFKYLIGNGLIGQNITLFLQFNITNSIVGLGYLFQK